MKYPKKIRTHCPTCNAHREHKVSKESSSAPNPNKWGQRQFERVKAGYGGQPRPRQKGGPKVSNKTVLILECTECGKKQVRTGPRTKKLIIGD